MVIDLHCRDDEATSISGVVAVIDLKGAGLGHATSMTPSMIRKAVNSWQDVTPIRTKQMYFINTPYNVHLVLNIFKKFMKEKLRQRVWPPFPTNHPFNRLCIQQFQFSSHATASIGSFTSRRTRRSARLDSH